VFGVADQLWAPRPRRGLLGEALVQQTKFSLDQYARYSKLRSKAEVRVMQIGRYCAILPPPRFVCMAMQTIHRIEDRDDDEEEHSL